VNIDDFVKSPPAALRFSLRHCGVAITTPHSSGFARLACGSFSEIVRKRPFFDFINIDFYFSLKHYWIKHDNICS